MTPKPYHLMTPAERLAYRVATNRAIDARISEARLSGTRPVSASAPQPSVGGTRYAVGAVVTIRRNGRLY